MGLITKAAAMNAKHGRDVAFAVRGDIVSNTGYAHAARAMASILAEISTVYGISIHVDPMDRSEPFPGDIIDMDDVDELVQNTFLVVIHHTTPDHFIPVLDAVNIGVFYWETTTIPHRYLWTEHIACMDAIWAPTTFIRDFVRSTGYEGSLFVVPWPHDFDPVKRRPSASSKLDGVQAIRIDRMPSPDLDLGQAVPLTSLLGGERLVFLSVQSLSPRKGLPILVSDWCRFVAESSGDHLLILKLNFRHVHGVDRDHLQHFRSVLGQLGVRSGQRVNLALLEADLPRSSLQTLLGNSDCVVSATYGEGFGGPLVEALVEDTSVICPVHTGIADLFPADYALRIEHERAAVQLKGLVEVYPSSSVWHVPVSGSLTSVLHQFSTMRPEQVAAAKLSARRTAERFCSLDAGRAAILAAVNDLLDGRR